ncbi:hypothetical protein SLEP1_g15213 [Rubroshorea leprosula]|uniref:Uncharacterized protein n=1 Tax=Rubroshorea leprosula TaxID=152421 RepID=A0AAV5IUF3_9ROSI|nr:hypothetical protein SLEP1_g15213 [Rubroshorea leprosula]
MIHDTATVIVRGNSYLGGGGCSLHRPSPYQEMAMVMEVAPCSCFEKVFFQVIRWCNFL